MSFNMRYILNIVSLILTGEGLLMGIPLLCALWYGETDSMRSLLITMVFALAIGLILRRANSTNKNKLPKLKISEGFLVVTLSWMFIILIASFPYYLANAGYDYSACWLESAAGWTTTGCSAIPFDEHSLSLALWKILTGWVGGMGVILMTISLFPRLGIDGQKIAAAEVPGVKLEKLTSRMTDTARISYIIYIILTVLEFIALRFAGLGNYAALVDAMSTMSTSGIIDMSASHGVFTVSPMVKIIVTVFTLLSSTNFTAYYMITRGRVLQAFRISEIRAYYRMILVAGILVAIGLYAHGVYGSPLTAVGNGFSQTIAYFATSGYQISNLAAWPSFCKVILLFCMFSGGCSFSTSSGIKVQRVMVGFRIIIRGIYKRIHPNSIRPIMISRTPVNAKDVSGIAVFIICYFAIYIFASIIMALDNNTMETTFSIVAAALTNNGSGFGRMTTGDFSFLSAPGKFFISLVMVAGRLEIYSVLVFFSRSFWNANRTDNTIFYYGGNN